MSQEKNEMTQEQFRIALINLEKAICARNELFQWEIEQGDIQNAFYGDIRISYNDGIPVVITKEDTFFLWQFAQFQSIRKDTIDRVGRTCCGMEMYLSCGGYYWLSLAMQEYFIINEKGQRIMSFQSTEDVLSYMRKLGVNPKRMGFD